MSGRSGNVAHPGDTPAGVMRANAKEALGMQDNKGGVASASETTSSTSKGKGRGKADAKAAEAGQSVSSADRPKIGEMPQSMGLLNDMKTFRWMTQPGTWPCSMAERTDWVARKYTGKLNLLLKP